MQRTRPQTGFVCSRRRIVALQNFIPAT